MYLPTSIYALYTATYNNDNTNRRFKNDVINFYLD